MSIFLIYYSNVQQVGDVLALVLQLYVRISMMLT